MSNYEENDIMELLSILEMAKATYEDTKRDIPMNTKLKGDKNAIQLIKEIDPLYLEENRFIYQIDPEDTDGVLDYLYGETLFNPDIDRINSIIGYIEKFVIK